MRRLAAFVGSSIVTVALGLSVALPLSFAQNANSKIEQSTQVFSQISAIPNQLLVVL